MTAAINRAMQCFSVFVLLLNCALSYGQEPPHVSVTTNIPNPADVIIAGSALTLTCTIVLSETLGETVTVNTEWIGPPETQFTSTTPVATMVPESNTTCISTATLGSIWASDSGEYACRATVNSSSPLSIGSVGVSNKVVLVVADINCGYSENLQPKATGQVYFTLRGRSYSNNSEILLGCIGVEDNGLLCRTEYSECCRIENSATGEVITMGKYFFPNGSEVKSFSAGGRGLTRNRGIGIVRLNRSFNLPSSTGTYRCEIPDVSGTIQTLYVNIVLQLSSQPSSASDQGTPVTACVTTTRPLVTTRTTSSTEPSGINCHCTSWGIATGVVVVCSLMLTVLMVIGAVCVSKRYHPHRQDDKVTEARMEQIEMNGDDSSIYEEIKDHPYTISETKDNAMDNGTEGVLLSTNVAYHLVQPNTEHHSEGH